MKKLIALVLIIVGCLPLAAQDRVTKGKNLFLEGKTGEALALFRKAAEINPRDAGALLWLAKAYLAVGKADSADITAQNLIMLNSPYPTIKTAIWHLSELSSIIFRLLLFISKPNQSYVYLTN